MTEWIICSYGSHQPFRLYCISGCFIIFCSLDLIFILNNNKEYIYSNMFFSAPSNSILPFLQKSEHNFLLVLYCRQCHTQSWLGCTQFMGSVSVSIFKSPLYFPLCCQVRSIGNANHIFSFPCFEQTQALSHYLYTQYLARHDN